ncbi:MAG: type I glyceraldehyde-3-phosphate dehydrogenase [Clostridia bacterium]
MAIKIGINGFGRIGRSVLRIAAEQPEKFDICGINLRKADIPYMVYLMKYDSVFGRFNGTISELPDGICINGKDVKVFSESVAADIRWDKCGAEYIVESTGAFNTTELSKSHLLNGAKKVVLTAPAHDDVTPTYVMGVNHMQYKSCYDVVSNASCTTNCLAPLVKVVHESFGIEQGLMTTIHSATAKQKPVDARAGRDYRTGRSVFNNIIPSTTGAAKACTLVIPELAGRLTGMSFRVPTNNVSVTDLTAKLACHTTYAEVCKAVKAASEGSMKGIIAYTNDDVVSSDMRGEMHTCIFDEKAGIMQNGDFVKLIAWYDNEWGYSNKVLDLVSHMAQVDAK